MGARKRLLQRTLGRFNAPTLAGACQLRAKTAGRSFAAEVGSCERSTSTRGKTLDSPLFGNLLIAFSAFCPDSVDQGAETKAKLALLIREKGEIYFWWD